MPKNFGYVSKNFMNRVEKILDKNLPIEEAFLEVQDEWGREVKEISRQLEFPDHETEAVKRYAQTFIFYRNIPVVKQHIEKHGEELSDEAFGFSTITIDDSAINISARLREEKLKKSSTPKYIV